MDTGKGSDKSDKPKDSENGSKGSTSGIKDYGQEYRRLERERIIYMSLKESLKGLCPTLQSSFLNQEKLKDIG